MAGHRKERIEELIRRLIGDMLLTDIKDPRIGFATVYRVEVSRDLSVADVFVSVIGDAAQKRKTIAGLSSASGFIRSRVGDHVKLRQTPEIKFHLDDSIEKGNAMVDLLTKLEHDSSRSLAEKREAEGNPDREK
jgi:ribosome-binding factor A